MKISTRPPECLDFVSDEEEVIIIEAHLYEDEVQEIIRAYLKKLFDGTPTPAFAPIHVELRGGLCKSYIPSDKGEGMKAKTMGFPEDWWEAMQAEAKAQELNLAEWIRGLVAKELESKGHSLTRVRKRGEFDHSDPGYRSKMSDKKWEGREWEWVED